VAQHSAFLKLERAKTHLAELKRLVESFYESPPWEILNRINPENENRREYYISNAKEMPNEILLVTGDILHNLQSALDHIAYGLCSGSTERKERIYFPIADSKADYEKNKAAWTKGMSREAKAKLDELKPYRGGNDALWRLKKLNNIDKHRLLITAECCFPSLDFGAYIRQTADQEIFPFVPSFYLEASAPVPLLRNGEILFVDLPNAKVVDIPHETLLITYISTTYETR